MKWYRRAADQGNADAQSESRGYVHEGRGVPQDDTEAREVVSPRCGPRAMPRRQYNLGVMYDKGRACRKTTPRR